MALPGVRIPSVSGGPVSPRGGGSASSGGSVFPKAAGLTFQRGNSVVRRRRPPGGIRYSWGGGGVQRNEGVEDTNADMEELLARSQKRLLIEVRPLPEWRSKREAARRKGREMLCRELCLHLGLTPEELGAMWRGGGLEEKVGEFLEEWGWMHRPLSQRAAMEMLDEHMASIYGRNPRTRAPSTPRGPLRLLLRAFGRDHQEDSSRDGEGIEKIRP